MKVTIMLDEVARTGLVTLDGPMGEAAASEAFPLIDQLITGMGVQGWTFLLGTRNAAPTLLDPQTVIRKLAQRQRSRYGDDSEDIPVRRPTPGGTPSEPAAVPETGSETGSETPEERRSKRFHSWMPKPGEAPPSPDGPDDRDLGDDEEPDDSPSRPNPPPEPA